MRTIQFGATALLCVLLATPALAEKPDHAGKASKGKHEAHEERGHEADRDDDRVQVTVNIGSDDRTVIRSYLGESYRADCPPGLAKKHNGCQPPGQAKKYRIGGAVPPGYQPLPPLLIERLSPPPPGTFYAMVDRDVLLVAEAGHKIIDAITLLSAVN